MASQKLIGSTDIWQQGVDRGLCVRFSGKEREPRVIGPKRERAIVWAIPECNEERAKPDAFEYVVPQWPLVRLKIPTEFELDPGAGPEEFLFEHVPTRFR